MLMRLICAARNMITNYGIMTTVISDHIGAAMSRINISIVLESGSQNINQTIVRADFKMLVRSLSIKARATYCKAFYLVGRVTGPTTEHRIAQQFQQSVWGLDQERDDS